MSATNTMPPKYFAPELSVMINGARLEADVSKQIERVTIVSEVNSLDQFSFTIANPYPKMRWTHDERDRQLFALGNGVVIELGYVGQEPLRFSGDITLASTQFPESGAPSLEVQGHTKLHRLTRQRRSQSFQKQTEHEIVGKIAQDNKLGSQVDDTPATRIVYADVRQENQTDLEFLQERANRIHFAVNAQDDRLVFSRSRREDNPVITLKWGENLRNFSPTKNTRKQVSEVTVRGYSPRDKGEIVGRFTAPPAGGESGAEVSEKAFGHGAEVHVDSPIASQDEANKMAEAIFWQRSESFLTGRGATIGLPVLKAGVVVNLAGLGQFDGPYRLTQVTHSIDSGGYATSFAGTGCL